MSIMDHLQTAARARSITHWAERSPASILRWTISAYLKVGLAEALLLASARAWNALICGQHVAYDSNTEPRLRFTT